MYAEAYLEPSQTSMVELLCENHEKNFLADAQCAMIVSPINKTHFGLTNKV